MTTQKYFLHVYAYWDIWKGGNYAFENQMFNPDHVVVRVVMHANEKWNTSELELVTRMANWG